MNGHLRVLRVVLRADQGECFFAAMETAIFHNNLKVLRYLVKHAFCQGISLDRVRPEALTGAITYGNIKAVKYLIKQDPNITLSIISRDNLVELSKSGRRGALQFLFEHNLVPSNLFVVSAKSAIERGQINIVRFWLVNHPYDIRVLMCLYQTAKDRHQTAIVRLMIFQGLITDFSWQDKLWPQVEHRSAVDRARRARYLMAWTLAAP
jgi:hypothetical protein